ncbi:MAG: acetate--CoA ligase family protein [Nitrospirae bacterium]|nr:acetate--CoA ligase family protein [Nitrospirota bacterium]
MIATDDSALKNTASFLEKNKGKKVFVEHEAKRFLKNAGLPVPNGMLVGKDGYIPSSNLAYPLAAKVSSAKITSKSDVGGIRLGLKNDAELKKAVSELLKIEHAEGVLVEEMAPEGRSGPPWWRLQSVETLHHYYRPSPPTKLETGYTQLLLVALIGFDV